MTHSDEAIGSTGYRDYFCFVNERAFLPSHTFFIAEVTASDAVSQSYACMLAEVI